MKVDRMAKRSSLGSRVRRRLSDITNSLPQPKSASPIGKPSPTDPTADYIERLIKENMAMVQMIAEKNKIIELTGFELKKLRVSLEKMQLQNWNLAKTNSHMLAELNLGKDRLKSLQHELVCKDALLKAKASALKGQSEMNGRENDSQEREMALEAPNLVNDIKSSNGNKRRSTRSRSMGHLCTSLQGAEKEASENKRRCLRRQSAKYNPQLQKPIENLFELENINYPISMPSPMHEDGPTSSMNNKEEKNQNSAVNLTMQESRRTSYSGRPQRKAVEKVQSYKEAPVNIKMRRLE